MSMFQSTATVTSIFSLSRSRPVERRVSTREVIGGKALHVAREQDVVISVGRAIARAQLPDDEARDGRNEQDHRRADQHIRRSSFHLLPLYSCRDAGAAARPRGPWKYTWTQG